MSYCSNSRGKSLTSRGLRSGLMVSILVFFPLPPSSVAHDLVGGAAPCSGSLHAAGAKASTHGQNGGIAFEKETCLLCFQATERKVKRLGLAIQILS